MIPSNTDSTVVNDVHNNDPSHKPFRPRPSEKHTHPSPPQLQSDSPKFLRDAKTLPPPGPTHYAARRHWWLTPTPATPSHRTTPSSAHLRLEHLLSQPGAVHSNDVWQEGVEKVWKGLLSGGRLRRRLPLDLVIKVIHAGWLRDPETWPAGTVAPDSDVDLPVPMHGAPSSSSATTTLHVEGEKTTVQKARGVL